MKRSGIVLARILVVLTAITGVANAFDGSSHSVDVLRTITVERHTKIELGKKLADGSDFCIWSGRTCTLKPGTFGGTEMMFLNTTETGLIAQFHFYYGIIDSDKEKEQVDNFRRLLGKSAHDSTVRSGPYDIREIDWNDGVTSFELLFKVDGATIEESATISDDATARRSQR